MTWVINFLRRKDVQKYLATHRVDEVFTWLSKEIKALRSMVTVGPLLAGFDRTIKVVEGLVSKVTMIPAVGDKAMQVLKQVKHIRLNADSGLATALAPIREMIDTILLRLEKEILEKQRGIVDVSNVHYRGVLPESAAIALMRKRAPKWLTKSDNPIYEEIEPKIVRQQVNELSARVLPNGKRREHKEIFPELSDQNIRSFHTLKANKIKGPARLYRIISPNSRAMSDCWVSEEVFRKLQKSPNPREAWRKYLAVWPDWNVNGQFVIYDIKAGESLNVWQGIAASQKKDGLPGYQLEGGWEQIVFKITRKDTRNDKIIYYKQSGGKNPILRNSLTQDEVNSLTAKMNDMQKTAFYSNYIPIREEINHPNISGPFSTGWGYTDLDGAGMASKVGIPALPGQVTN